MYLTLFIHDIRLAIDGSLVDGFEYPFHEFDGEVVFAGFFCDAGEDAFPTVGLEDGDVVLFFIKTDFLDDFHAVGEGFHDGVVEGVDFLSEFLDDQVCGRVIRVGFPDNQLLYDII